MKFRSTSLPQLGDHVFLSDGGIETTLIFQYGIDLPYFAAFDLLRTDMGRATLISYYESHIEIAKQTQKGFILESPTWRASRDWGEKLGYSAEAIEAVNRQAIVLMQELRVKHETAKSPMVVSGCVGPRGDGYVAGEVMSVAEAEAYHAHQIGAFAAAGADMVTAITMTNSAEAIGIVRAAEAVGLPVAISFTLETDGCLPTGQSLAHAIGDVDATTDDAPAYYMINCAHPTHFEEKLIAGEAWTRRIRGMRANASRMSHAELNEATELDAGDPVELGANYRDIRRLNPQITVLGGCCGTDHRHIAEIAAGCIPA